MEKRYGGDLAKMWAAYNAGPGRVDDLVKQYGENWLSHAPAETRAYVMKNVAAVGGATSAYANAPREWDSAAVYDNLDKVAEREGWTPERTERVRGELDRRIKRDEGLLQEKRSDAEDKASDIAASNPTAFRVSMIPRDVWNAMTPTQQAKFRKVEEDLTKPKEPKANGAYSLTLSVMQRLEPDRFKREDILAHANELTPSEITSFFISQQEAIRKPPAAFQPQSAIQEAINRGAKYQGVKLDDKDLPRVYDTMEAVLRTRFGKNGTINANDADEAFRTAVATTRTEEHGLLDRFLGPRAGSKPAYEVTAQDIPEAWRSRFERNWRGGGRPTPAQILDAYRRSMHLAQ